MFVQSDLTGLVRISKATRAVLRPYLGVYKHKGSRKSLSKPWSRPAPLHTHAHTHTMDKRQDCDMRAMLNEFQNINERLVKLFAHPTHASKEMDTVYVMMTTQLVVEEMCGFMGGSQRQYLKRMRSILHDYSLSVPQDKHVANKNVYDTVNMVVPFVF
mmetsp:Transcript_24497/g.46446  ORF Transcript_24497/g.46446 Transcript_24497/m.46446 type:complete len:158 (+) Transcript_24497:1696-2169(+)